MKIVNNLEELKKLSGAELGNSDYLTITQSRIENFAEATGDHQWIHTDPERAAQESPFGKTIAHGYLTLSLAPALLTEILDVRNTKLALNYGLDKLRFIEPVPVDGRIRMRARLLAVEEKSGAARCKFEFTFERENAEKPACVAEVLYMYKFN